MYTSVAGQLLQCAAACALLNEEPCQPFIPAVHLEVRYSYVIRVLQHSSALCIAQQACQPFQPYILIVAVQLSCTQSAALCTTAVACCSVLHCQQSHANHSVQLYIFLWLHSYHVTLLRAACAVVQQCAAACVHCSTSRFMPTIPAVHL
jgi:hypothetical protein